MFSGTKGVVARKTVHSSMKFPRNVRRVQPRVQGGAHSQEGKRKGTPPRLRASFGRLDAASGGTSVNSPMKVNSDPGRPPLQDRLHETLKRVTRARKTDAERRRETDLSRGAPVVRVSLEALDPPKGSRGSKGSAGKSTPAAVCLVASMLASVVDGLSLSGPTSMLDQIGINVNESQAAWEGEPHIACPGVSFNLKPDITKDSCLGQIRSFCFGTIQTEEDFPSKLSDQAQRSSS